MKETGSSTGYEGEMDDENGDEAPKVEKQRKNRREGKKDVKPKKEEQPKEEVKMDPETDRRYRLGLNLQMAMIDAYGPRPEPEAARIATVSRHHAREVSLRLEQEHMAPDIALLELMNLIVANLSGRSDINFVLSKGTINAVKKSLKRSEKFKDVEFYTDEFPFIEDEMIKAAGGRESFDVAIESRFSTLIQGAGPEVIRRAFINLERAEELIHNEQNINWNHKAEMNPEKEAYDPETVNLILEEQNFSSQDLISRPLGVDGILQLMEIDKKWPELDEKQREKVLMVMARIAQHFKARLLTGPEGPHLDKYV